MYYEISIDVLVDGCAKGSKEDETVGGRRLSDRLAEPGCLEARLVALRLLGRITAEEFLGGLEGYGGQVRRWLKAGRGGTFSLRTASNVRFYYFRHWC